MDHRIKFAYPTFHPGLNVTVRRGSKWHHRLRSEMERIESPTLTLTTLDDYAMVSSCEVLFLRTYELREIPQAVLDLEHDKSCHTLDGLMDELCSVYDGEAISSADLVTVIGFIVPDDKGVAS